MELHILFMLCTFFVDFRFRFDYIIITNYDTLHLITSKNKTIQIQSYFISSNINKTISYSLHLDGVIPRNFMHVSFKLLANGALETAPSGPTAPVLIRGHVEPEY